LLSRLEQKHSETSWVLSDGALEAFVTLSPCNPVTLIGANLTVGGSPNRRRTSRRDQGADRWVIYQGCGRIRRRSPLCRNPRSDILSRFAVPPPSPRFSSIREHCTTATGSSRQHTHDEPRCDEHSSRSRRSAPPSESPCPPPGENTVFHDADLRRSTSRSCVRATGPNAERASPAPGFQSEHGNDSEGRTRHYRLTTVT